MTPARAKFSIEDWADRSDEVLRDRCELDLLLREEWRHKIVARDDGTPRATARHEMTIAGSAYTAMKEQQRSGAGGSPGALSLVTLHTSLAAFAQGSKTVIAFVDATCSVSAGGADTFPTVIDHADLSAMTCSMAVARIDEILRDHDAYQHSHALFGRGLFDTALVFSEVDLPDSGLPPTPLAAIVQDDERDGCLRGISC